MTQKFHSWVHIRKKLKWRFGRDVGTHVHCSTIRNSQTTEILTDRWKDEENVNTYNGIWFSLKKRNSAICDNKDGQGFNTVFFLASFNKIRYHLAPYYAYKYPGVFELATPDLVSRDQALTARQCKSQSPTFSPPGLNPISYSTAVADRGAFTGDRAMPAWAGDPRFHCPWFIFTSSS